MKLHGLYETLYKSGSKLKGWQSWTILERQRQAQWRSKEAMKAEADKQLRNLLLHAYQHSDYYRKALGECGVVKDDTVRLERFAEVPLLSKELLKAHAEELRARGEYQNGRWNTSGGSTGALARFYQDETFRDHSRANKFLLDEWTGTRIGDKRLWLWGSERDLLYGKETMAFKLNNWVNRRVQLNTFRMTKERQEEYIKTINEFKPNQILSYVQSIDELARYVERNKLVINPPSSIMVTAGTLFPEIRRRVERVFGAPVFNRYGSREVGDIAGECDHHKGLHVLANTHHIEIIREDGSYCEPGEVGEIVVTLLTNYAMPMIRYRIGDRGSWAGKACSCGRHWPLLKSIEGRVSDMIRTKDGTVIDGVAFHKVFYELRWLNQFQVIQEEIDKFTISLVPESIPNNPEEAYASELKKIEELVEKTMKHPVSVDFKIEQDIPPTASGKFRHIISKVSI